MSPRHAAPARARAARHAPRPRRHPFLRAIALVATAAVTFATAGSVAAYVRIERNIATHDITDQLGERPQQAPVDPEDPNAGRPLNILVMGSDVRDGQNAEIGGDADGMRSDTTILLHISGDRQRVEMVSIPRDSMVQIPPCVRSDGTTSSGRLAMFNEAFSIGSQSGEVADAAACTIKTVESLTGVFVDGWVVVDFAGFIGMVDALGGIPMCIPHEMRSAEAGLHVQPGNQVLDGPTALAFARARKGLGLGDGSDTGRITRQQDLLAATASAVLSKNLLTDSPALYRFLTAATRSLTTDPDTGNIPTLAGLAFSLRNIPSGNIHFMTVPWEAYRPDPNRVQWTAEAAGLWERIATDQPIVAPVAPPEGESPDGAPTGGTGEAGAGDGTDRTSDPGASPADPGTEAPAAPEQPETTTPPPVVDTITPDDLATVCG